MSPVVSHTFQLTGFDWDAYFLYQRLNYSSVIFELSNLSVIYKNYHSFISLMQYLKILMDSLKNSAFRIMGSFHQMNHIYSEQEHIYCQFIDSDIFLYLLNTFMNFISYWIFLGFFIPWNRKRINFVQIKLSYVLPVFLKLSPGKSRRSPQ